MSIVMPISAIIRSCAMDEDISRIEMDKVRPHASTVMSAMQVPDDQAVAARCREHRRCAKHTA
jgi:hypothetical protein